MILITPRGQNTTLALWPIAIIVVHHAVEDFREHVAEAVIGVVAMATIGEMVMVITITTIVTGIDPDHIQGPGLDQGQDRGPVVADLALEAVVAPDLAADPVVLAAELVHLGLGLDHQGQGRVGPDREQNPNALDRGHVGRNPSPKSRCRCRNLRPSTWLQL